ncbi:MAG: AAA domain-containing protein, partial [Acidobacteria bacterium]|nr:AAA domain-containing protein [Acidobacteriota bacterium]
MAKTDTSNNPAGATAKAEAIEKYLIKKEPYYVNIKDESSIFETAFQSKLPVMLKGPTGCGKTRFVEAMAYKLGRPLITVACHEDLSATDLVGRFLIE